MSWVVELLLLFLQKVDNKLLVLLNEIIGQPLVLKVLSEVLSPKGVESFQQSELRRWSPAIEWLHNVVLDRGRRCCHARRF